MTKKREPTPRPEDSATVWVALLERGRLTGDSELTRRANRELRRLGVRVVFEGDANTTGRGERGRP